MPTDKTLAERLLHEIINSGFDDWTVRVAALVIATLLAPIFAKLIYRLYNQFRKIMSASTRLRRAEGAVAKDGGGIWLAPTIPMAPPANYTQLKRSIPILTVANLKGGVGKTTISANLVAHYAIKKEERVLAIDFDYQGSLSSMLLSEAEQDTLYQEQSDSRTCRASYLIDRGTDIWLQSVASQVQGAGLERAKVIPSFYSLAGTENRMMIEWLLNKRSNDIRYSLSSILLSDAIQSRYDRIIIDAPPRLTTACIQALTASTSVVIPTVLDSLSAQAVGTFADQLRIHQQLWPNLRICGVLGNMTAKNLGADPEGAVEKMNAVEADAFVNCRDVLSQSLQTAVGPLRDAALFPASTFIPDKIELGRAAGERIAYASPTNSQPIQQIRDVFDRLGDEIDNRHNA
jgi:cellulose biosynthesis protein BcsQ